MKLAMLFEADERIRNLERASHGDSEALVRLAIGYLRTNDPRIEELIWSLKELNDPTAEEIIQTWAETNGVPTAEDFVLGLSKTRDGIGFSEASEKARDLKFRIVDQDENGRGGYAVGVEIWESPAGGQVWLVWESGYEEFDEEPTPHFNYGIVDPEDHEGAKNYGLLDHYRDYLY